MNNIKKEKNNVNLEVWSFLRQDPFILRYMYKKLINIRALARFIINEKKINASLDAVISSIRRYNITNQILIYEKAKKIFSQIISISTKNQLICIELIKDIEVQQLLPKLFTIIDYEQADILIITHTEKTISIYINNDKLNNIEKIIPKNKIKHVYKNLAAINVKINKEALKIPGIIALIANEFAIYDINTIELITSGQELIWFLDDKDLLDAFSYVNKLMNEN